MPRPTGLLSALLAGTTLLLATSAPATHAPDHRFLVIGFVTDGEGRAVAGTRVVVTRLRTGLEHPATTEADGLYFVVLHLHDEDEGERLLIQSGGGSGEFRARFDVGQRRLERGTRIDLRAGQVVEQRQAFAETLRAYLAR